MSIIHIALQEGFENDDIDVYLDELRVYSKKGLKTRMQIGLADEFSFDGGPGMRELCVKAETRNAEVRIAVSAIKEQYIGVSINSDGKLFYKISEEPFMYA